MAFDIGSRLLPQAEKNILHNILCAIGVVKDGRGVSGKIRRMRVHNGAHPI
jgi:hypothetical protein